MNMIQCEERLFTKLTDTSLRSYYHEFKKVVEAADVILEVLDARDPIGCRCPDVEQVIAAKYPIRESIRSVQSFDRNQLPKQENYTFAEQNRSSAKRQRRKMDRVS